MDVERWLLGLLSPDATESLNQISRSVVWIVPGDSAFGGGRHEGLAQVGDFLLVVLELFPDGLSVSDVHRVASGPSHAVVELTLSGTTATRSDYSNRYAFAVAHEDGLVTEVVEYCDTAYAETVLRARGRSESGAST